jgi:arylformamidase
MMTTSFRRAPANTSENAVPLPIVDLSVPIGRQTFSPPSVNRRVELDTVYRGPGHWQSTFVDMSLHTGTHADFPLHVVAGGEDAQTVELDRLCGPAILIDLGDLGPGEPITREAVESSGACVRPGDIALVRTGWAEKMWGIFPDYYLQSPYCDPEACRWLVDRDAKAIGFDCFSEYAARLPEFSPEDFVIHKIILESGAILIQHLTNLSSLPAGRRFQFFGACLKIAGAEGSPGRFFAVLDEKDGTGE